MFSPTAFQKSFKYRIFTMRALRIRLYYCYRRLLFPICITLLIAITYLLLNWNRGSNQFPLLDSSRHLPLLYWYHRSMYPQGYRNFTCARAPSPRRIQHYSPFWQIVTSNTGNVLAASAFWDERFESAAVRVIVYSDLKDLDHLICQLWYFNRVDPVIVSARDIYAWNDADDQRDEFEDDIYDQVKPKVVNASDAIIEPHVLSCTAPNASEAPTAVSLVNAPCAHATNMLNVQGAPIKELIADRIPGLWGIGEQAPKMSDVEESKGVCVCAILPPHHRNVAIRLVEWIELLKLFGVGRIYLYMTVAHPNVRSVINHYQWSGFLVVSYFSEPLAEPPFNQREKNMDGPSKVKYRKKRQVIYNDCLYRAIGWYRWILPLHLDDMILPLRDGKLDELAVHESEQYQNSFDAFSFETYLFSPRAADHPDPTMVQMVDHEWRMKEPSRDELVMRCLNRIDRLLVIQEHRPLWCGEGPMRLSDGTLVDRSSKKHLCQLFHVDPNTARVHAFGASCRDCKDLVSDTTMHRWWHVSFDVDRVLSLTQHRYKKEN